MQRRRVVIGAAVLLASGRGGTAQPEELVEVGRGTLPLLLTAPHGGQLAVPGVEPRTRGVKLADSGTDDVARRVATHLEALLRRRPHLVVARFHRRFIDANRTEKDALEVEAARRHYRAFHGAVRAAVDEIGRLAPERGLLLDIHGQSEDLETIHRGTREGQTVTRLLKRHGEAGLVGPKSIFGGLKAAGFNLFPDNTPLGMPAERKSFGGGFIVATYGSHQLTGIDAIQIEIGRSLRETAAVREKLARALATSIAEYHKTYQVM